MRDLVCAFLPELHFLFASGVDLPLGVMRDLRTVKVTTDWYGHASKTLVSHLAQNIKHNSGSLTSLHLVEMYTWAAVWTVLLASGGGGGGGVRPTLRRTSSRPSFLRTSPRTPVCDA
jgi:hypothetical protein